MSDSRISGLYRHSINKRIQILADAGFIDESSAERLRSGAPLLPKNIADRMIENVVGVFGLPLGIATNFQVNGKDYVVPMVVEEPSIVAGVSGAAKIFRQGGGFQVTSDESLLIGQIHLSTRGDVRECIRELKKAKQSLIDIANDHQPRLVARGGGVTDIEYYDYSLSTGDSVVVLHLLVDTCDAMGANLVNTICERLSQQIERLTTGKAHLRILSNLADRALVTARGTVTLSALAKDPQKAESIRDDIVAVNEIARVDPHRAATHNKGIMNGVDALAIATGNDWRAIEAGAHAFAARTGSYQTLTEWSVNDQGDLVGELRLPLKPGIVGGSIQANPGAELGLSICSAESAIELAALMGAMGLAQNFAALNALVTSGIQKGHMALHARSVAAAARVPEGIFDDVVDAMIETGDIKTSQARDFAAKFGNRRSTKSAPQVGHAASGIAAGKVILLGEHAVVYDRHAVAVPIANAVVARIKRCDSGISVSIPNWHLSQKWSSGDIGLDGVAAIIQLIMDETGVNDSGYDVDLDARIPMGVGLGSSAALAVAAIRAFDQLASLDMKDHEINALAWKCEGIAHGSPSGIDNHVATYSAPILYRKSEEQAIEHIDLAQQPPLVVAASDTFSSTKRMVSGVRQRYKSNTTLYENIFDQIDELSLGGAAALRRADYGKLGMLMNVCHGLLNAIEVSSPPLEQMIKLARDAGAVGAKLTGAGGGGSIVALCPDKVSEVSESLSDAGYRIIQTLE